MSSQQTFSDAINVRRKSNVNHNNNNSKEIM